MYVRIPFSHIFAAGLRIVVDSGFVLSQAIEFSSDYFEQNKVPDLADLVSTDLYKEQRPSSNNDLLNACIFSTKRPS